MSFNGVPPSVSSTLCNPSSLRSVTGFPSIRATRQANARCWGDIPCIMRYTFCLRLSSSLAASSRWSARIYRTTRSICPSKAVRSLPMPESTNRYLLYLWNLTMGSSSMLLNNSTLCPFNRTSFISAYVLLVLQ